MIFRWNSVPLLRFLIAFSAGIVLQIFIPGYLGITIGLLSAGITVMLIQTFYKTFAVKFKLRHVFGIAAILVFLCTGSVITWLHTAKNYPDHYTTFLKGDAVFYGSINEPLVEKTSSYKTTINVTALYSNGQYYKTSGLLLLYLQKDSALAGMQYGDELIVKAKAKEIPLPQNPAEFNYKRFLYFHQIYMQAYAKKDDIVFINQNSGNSILSVAYQVRQRLVDLLKTYIPDKRQYAVAEALTVGYEDDLDQELIQAFASAGALHVLSVSGMHVGLIFASLLLLLQWTDRIKHAHHFKFALVLFIIWLYALITGMSPSIMRSAVMITLMITARWIKRDTTLYNTLAVSAFGLLIYNPYYITEVGFQLSYAAVFGIVYLHPMIARWYEPESWLMSQIWMITSVSIAAQTMTFPLGLLYFHQFPNLFVISNLIIIPLSTLVIYGCIILLAFSSLEIVAAALGKMIWGLIWLINKTVFMVDAWQYSLVNGISISIFETWIVYLIVFFTILFLTTKKPFHLHAVLAGICFVLFMQLIETYEINRQRKLIVYNIKQKTAINFIDGKNNIFLTDSALRYDRSKMLFHVIHNWWDMGVYDSEPRIPYASVALKSNQQNFYEKNGFIKFYDKEVLLVDSMFNYIDLPAVDFDYVIVSQNAFNKLKELSQKYKFKFVIIDSTNKAGTVKKIKTLCALNKTFVYDVNTTGAFILNF